MLLGGGEQGRAPPGTGPLRFQEEIFRHSSMKKSWGLGEQNVQRPCGEREV